MARRVTKPRKISTNGSSSRLPKRWQLQDAKARLSHLIRESRKAPQIITVHGEEVAVLESIEQYRRRALRQDKGPNLLEALLACPAGPDLVIRRDPEDYVPKMPPIFGSND